MQIDLTKYPEKCDLCKQPARTELCTNERIGIEWFQFCVNEKCPQFDSWLKEKREIAEREARESAVGRRQREKLWAHEISRMNRQKRKVRASISKALNG